MKRHQQLHWDSAMNHALVTTNLNSVNTHKADKNSGEKHNQMTNQVTVTNLNLAAGTRNYHNTNISHRMHGDLDINNVS